MITPLPGATPQKPGWATKPFFGVEPVVLGPDGEELEGIVATHCNTLQHTATHCNTLKLTAVTAITATQCNTVQHTAAHYNTLQHTATHCNTLQHTATHCNAVQSLKSQGTKCSRICRIVAV